MHPTLCLLASLTLALAGGCGGRAVGDVDGPRGTGFGESRSPASALNATPSPADTLPLLRGMTFAHEGYDGRTGYDGESVYPSLDSLRRLHVDAVAIVPYTFQRRPDSAAALPIPTRRGMESDSAVAHVVRAAQARGMFVLIKPQIWLGGGHWPGDVDFGDDEAAWATWFGHYRDWIVHHARLAERLGADALCVGTELVRTTLTHPEAWRRIIADVRAEYGGLVTYAANWGEEFEGLSFWDALDAVGCNGYYPLSDDPDATDAELRDGAKAWLIAANNVAARAGRPLWLTEVGYRSVRRAWLNPHASPQGRARSDDCQRRCFAALTEATAEAPMLRAMFVWKWPSYLGYAGGGEHWGGGRRGTVGGGFTPGGKPAGEVLAAFYRTWGR